MSRDFTEIDLKKMYSRSPRMFDGIKRTYGFEPTKRTGSMTKAAGEFVYSKSPELYKESETPVPEIGFKQEDPLPIDRVKFVEGDGDEEDPEE